MRWRRCLVVAGVVVGGAVGLGLAGVVGFAAFLRTESGNAWLTHRVEQAADAAIEGGELRIGRIRTDLWGQWRIEDVRLVATDGRTVARIGRLAADLRPLDLLDRQLLKPALRADDVELDLVRGADGNWDIVKMFGGGGPPSQEPSRGLPIAIRDARVDVAGLSLVLREEGGSTPLFSASGLGGGLRFGGGGKTFVADEIDLGGTLVQPGPSVVRIGGGLWIARGTAHAMPLAVTLPGSDLLIQGSAASDVLDLRIDASTLDLARVDALAGSPGISGAFGGSVRATGPLSALQVTGALRGRGDTEGTVAVGAVLDLAAESVGYKGQIDVADFHVERVYPAAGGTVGLNGKLTFDGHGVRWPDDVVVQGTYQGGGQDIRGTRFDSADVGFALADGALTVEHARVEGVVGVLETTGRIDLAGGPMDVHVHGTLEPKRLSELGASGFGTVGVLDAHVVGDVKDSTRGIRASGSVHWAPFVYGKDVRFARVDADFDVHVVGSVVDGTARARTASGAAYGVAVASSDSRDLRFAVHQDRSVDVSGRTLTGPLEQSGVFHAANADASWTVHRGARGDQRVTAATEVGEWNAMGFPGSGGTAKIDLQGEQLAFEVSLHDGDREAVGTDGSYQLDSGEVSLQRLVLAPTPRAVWVASGPSSLRVIPGGVADAHLALTGNLGGISVDGTLAREGTLDGTVAVSGLQLDALAELFPEKFGGLAGVLDGNVTLAGPANDPAVDGKIAAHGIWYPDAVRWLDVDGTFTGAHRALDVDLSLGVAGDPLADVVGRLPVNLDLGQPGLDPRGTADVAVNLRPGDLARISRLAPAAGELPDGNASARLEVSGPLDDPALHLAGVAEVAVPAWDHPGRLEFDLRRDGDRADVRLDARDEDTTGLASVDGGGRTRLSEVFAWALGEAPQPTLEDWTLYADDLDVNVALLGAPLDSMLLASTAGVDASGGLYGGFEVTGSPYVPKVNGGLQWLDPKLGQQPLDGAYLSVQPGDRGYDVDLELTFPGEGGLSVVGAVPVQPDFRTATADWSTGDLDLKLDGPGIPLLAISSFDPAIRSAQGVAAIHGTIGGTAFDPDPQLDASISGASLEYPPLGLRISDINAQISGRERRIQLTKLTAHTEPLERQAGLGQIGESGESSQVRAAGSLQLGSGGLGAMTASVDLSNGAWVWATPDRQVRANGRVMISGRYPDLSVDGQVALQQGRVVLDAASFLHAAPLSPDPRLHIDRMLGTLPDEVLEEALGPSLAETIAVDLDVDLARNLDLTWTLPFADDFGGFGAAVAQMDLEARIGGTAHVSWADGKPGATGSVDVIEGRVRVLRSQFDLAEGTIAFTGGDPYEPTLDLPATMTIPGATVDLHVTGTPSSPNIDLHSDEYPDQTAILTILITGRAPEDLTTDQGAAAAQAGAGLLLNSVLSGTNLGNVSIDPDGAIRVGIPVSQTIYAESTVTPAAPLGENELALKLEWSLARRLVLDAALGDAKSWTDLYWEFRF